MLKNDESCVNLSGVADDLLPVLEDLLNGDCTACDVKIWKTERLKGRKGSERMVVYLPPVSNVAVGLILVQITGVSPIAKEMARTRSLEPESATGKKRRRQYTNAYSISPYGGLIMLGVTPSTSLMTFLDQPNSAMISSFVNVVNDG